MWGIFENGVGLENASIISQTKRQSHKATTPQSDIPIAESLLRRCADALDTNALHPICKPAITLPKRSSHPAMNRGRTFSRCFTSRSAYCFFPWLAQAKRFFAAGDQAAYAKFANCVTALRHRLLAPPCGTPAVIWQKAQVGVVKRSRHGQPGMKLQRHRAASTPAGSA